MRGPIAAMALLALTACSDNTDPTTGCPKVMLTEIGRASQRACEAAYHEELARQRGGTVSRCFDTSSGTTCITY